MGNVRKRRKAWNAQVRVSGQRNFTKSFKPKSDALYWIKELENILKSTDKPTADINDLRFHDLRHEVFSRFFEIGSRFRRLVLHLGIRM